MRIKLGRVPSRGKKARRQPGLALRDVHVTLSWTLYRMGVLTPFMFCVYIFYMK